jgi:hypothetical protein
MTAGEGSIHTAKAHALAKSKGYPWNAFQALQATHLPVIYSHIEPYWRAYVVPRQQRRREMRACKGPSNDSVGTI